MMEGRSVRVHEILRYTKTKAHDTLSHPYRNYWDVQKFSSGPAARLMLEAGINSPGQIETSEGRARRPVVILRSSPHKAGSRETPWHDEYDLVRGYVQYFGDHRVSHTGPLGSTAGNKILLETWGAHRAPSREGRIKASPVLLFRTRQTKFDGRIHKKGFVEFCGLAVVSNLVDCVQLDPESGRRFPNLAARLVMLELGADDQLDWTWIDARRRSDLDDEEVLALAPPAWRRWVEDGPSSLAQIRRVEQDGSSRSTFAWDVSQTLAHLRERVMPVEGARNWLSARVLEGILIEEGARIHIDPLNRETPVIGSLSIGTSFASMDVRIKGRVETDASVITRGMDRLVSTLGVGEIGVEVVWCDTSPSFREMVTSERPAVMILGPEGLAAEALRIADNSFGGDVQRLVKRALDESQQAGKAMYD